MKKRKLLKRHSPLGLAIFALVLLGAGPPSGQNPLGKIHLSKQLRRASTIVVSVDPVDFDPCGALLAFPSSESNPDQDPTVLEQYKTRLKTLEEQASDGQAEAKVATVVAKGVTVRAPNESIKTGIQNPPLKYLENPSFRVVELRKDEVVVEAFGEKFVVNNVRSGAYVFATAMHQSRVSAWKKLCGYEHGHEDLRGADGRAQRDIADVLSQNLRLPEHPSQVGTPGFFNLAQIVAWARHGAFSRHHQPVLMPGEARPIKERDRGLPSEVPQAKGLEIGKDVAVAEAIEIAVEKFFDVYDAITDTHRAYRKPVDDLEVALKIVGLELPTRIETDVHKILAEYLRSARKRALIEPWKEEELQLKLYALEHRIEKELGMN